MELTKDDKTRLTHCLSVYVSYTAASVITTDYTEKSRVCTSWKQS